MLLKHFDFSVLSFCDTNLVFHY